MRLFKVSLCVGGSNIPVRPANHPLTHTHTLKNYLDEPDLISGEEVKHATVRLCAECNNHKFGPNQSCFNISVRLLSRCVK